jgi:hypothetical protein
MVALFLIFRETSIVFSLMTALVYILTNMCIGTLSLQSCQNSRLVFLIIANFYWSAVIFPCGFDLHFLMISNVVILSSTCLPCTCLLLWNIYLGLLLIFIYLIIIWTQSLGLARQVLYHLNHTPSAFCFGYFWNRVFHLFLG